MSITSPTRLERWPEMSTPASAITATARGFSPYASMPAEYASTTSPRSALAHPSAIWLRQELPVQRNRTFSFCSMVWRSLSALVAAAQCLLVYLADGLEALGIHGDLAGLRQ